MKTAVVILNYNGRHYLEKFLPDVIKFSGSADVIVADNASTDDSVAFLAEHYPELRLIVLDKNYGFAEGYNRALSQVDSEYFVLLNSDVLVTPDWLTTMESYLDSNVDIAAVQPKILSYSERLSMPVLRAGLSTSTVIRFAVGVSSILWKQTMGSTMT